MKKNFFQTSKFANRLMVYLILVVSFGLVILMAIIFQSTKSIIHDEVVAHLLSVAQSRVDQIETYILEREKNAITLANAPVVKEAINKYIEGFSKGTESNEYITADKAFRQYLTYYSEQFGYYDILLISKQGDVVFTVAMENDFGKNLKSDLYRDTELAFVFEKSKKELETSVSQFRYYQPSGEPAVFIATPTYDKDRFIGVIAFQIRAHDLYQLSQDYTGLGETGEVVLGSIQEGIVQFVAPLRHDEGSAFQRSVMLGSHLASPIQKAVQGENGFGTAIDYQGIEIIAVWRYIPLLKWGMVAKINSSEAYDSLQRLQMITLIISVIMLTGIVLVAMLFSRTISAPILNLIQVTKEVGRGNLNVSVDINRQDEIGELSRAFELMVNDLESNQQKLRKQARKIEKDNFFKTGRAGLGDVLRGEQAIDKLTQHVMEYLAEFLKFQVGELYLIDSGVLKRVAGYASRSPNDESVHYQVGEGLVGQVASEKRLINFSKLPEEHFSMTINTGLGEVKPKSILGLPLLCDLQLIGVLVLGNPGDFTEDEIAFLKQAGESIAVAVSSAQSRQQLQKLLEKAKQQ